MESVNAYTLENAVLRHCLVSLFGWEGGLPDKTLCNREVLAGVAHRYATLLDSAFHGGRVPLAELKLLSEFLTEPSVETLGAVVDAIPASRRTFRQPRGRKSPPERDEPRHEAGNAADGETLAPEQVVAFIRKYEERSIVIMLTRGGGFTHARIARLFDISCSKCHRYEKWFEQLPTPYRVGIIAVGFAAAKRHHADVTAFSIVTELLFSPQAEEIVAAELDRKSSHGEQARASQRVPTD